MARPRKTKIENDEVEVFEKANIKEVSVKEVSVKEVAQESGNKKLDIESISIVPTGASYWNASLSDLCVGAIIESRLLHGNSWMITEIGKEHFENHFGNSAFMSIVKNLQQSPSYYRIKRIDDDDILSFGFSKAKTGVFTRFNCTIVIDLNKQFRNTQVYIDNECVFNGNV